MESVKQSKVDRYWIRSMEFGRKYCGCHQMPERSFFLGDYQFPLCARCTGIGAGHLLGITAAAAFRADLPYKVLLATLPLAADGTLQYLTKYESNNRRRFVTGLLYGFAVMSAIIHTGRLPGKLWREKRTRSGRPS